MGAADWDQCNPFKTLSLSVSFGEVTANNVRVKISVCVCQCNDGVVFVNHFLQSEAIVYIYTQIFITAAIRQ